MKQKKYNVLGVIPARSGSKRLPGKNIRILAGKPLISYTIEHGLNSKMIDRLVVSTDSDEISQIAKKFGAEVPFLRPEELAGDKVSDVPVLAHCVDWLEENDGYNPEIVVLLRPTIPLRGDILIDNCIDRLISTNADSVRSVRNVGHWHPYWMLNVDRDGMSSEFLPGKTIDKYYQSQLLPSLYKHDGYCDVFKRKNIPKNCSMESTLAGLYGECRQVLINDEGIFINIDTLEEFELAEFIINKNLKR